MNVFVLLNTKQDILKKVGNSSFEVPLILMVELGGMTKNLYHGIFLNYTGFTVYDGIYFFHA